MTTTNPTRRKRRNRRGRGTGPNPSSTPCPREGCRGHLKPSGQYCSFICGAIAKELDRAQRICQALGPSSPMAVELWTETVALSDGWSRHIELDRRIYRAALSVGITADEWQAIKSGTTKAQAAQSVAGASHGGMF